MKNRKKTSFTLRFSAHLFRARLASCDPYANEWDTVQWAREHVRRFASVVSDERTGLPTLDCIPPVHASIVRTPEETRAAISR